MKYQVQSLIIVDGYGGMDWVTRSKHKYWLGAFCKFLSTAGTNRIYKTKLCRKRALAQGGYMKVICGKRGDGKTTELIKLAAKDYLYIVCIDHDEAFRVSEQAQAMGLEIPFPLTFNEFVNRKFHSKGIKGFLVDNADLLISFMASGVPVKAVSISIAK